MVQSSAVASIRLQFRLGLLGELSVCSYVRFALSIEQDHCCFLSSKDIGRPHIVQLGIRISDELI